MARGGPRQEKANAEAGERNGGPRRRAQFRGLRFGDGGSQCLGTLSPGLNPVVPAMPRA